MKKIKGFKLLISRSVKFSVAVVFGVLILLNALPGGGVHASANELGSRSLTVTSSADGNTDTDIGGTPENPGQGGNGLKTGETFQFTLPAGTNVGSIAFIYCDGPLPGTTCNTPTGMTTANVTVAPTLKVNGTTDSNYTLDTTTTDSTFNTDAGISSGDGCNGSRVNCILLKRSSANTQSANDVFNVNFAATSTNYIVNPTNDDYTFFVRIIVFSDTGYTTSTDQGTVASATAQQVDVTAKVQETLNFSVTAGTPNAPGSTCTPLTSGTTGLTLGDSNGVLSATTAYNAHSYFRLSTNAFNGAVVQYSGDTLHSGSNTIAAINSASNPATNPGVAAASTTGDPQFGITIDSTDTQGGNGYSFTDLAAAANYNSTTAWAYDTSSVSTPVTIASSGSIVVCDTGSVNYLGNIAYSTPAGIYTTDLTYLVIPTY